MQTIHDQKPDSIIREIRCLKEDNAAPDFIHKNL